MGMRYARGGISMLAVLALVLIRVEASRVTSVTGSSPASAAKSADEPSGCSNRWCYEGGFVDCYEFDNEADATAFLERFRDRYPKVVKQLDPQGVGIACKGTWDAVTDPTAGRNYEDVVREEEANMRPALPDPGES
jgi:hypothetical protein